MGLMKYQYKSVPEVLDKSKKIVTLDGGLGTELESRGVDVNSTLWSSVVLLHDQWAIVDLHYDYFQQGANVAITCSYQSSARSLEEFGAEIAAEHGGMNVYSTVEQRRAIYDQCVNVAKLSREKYLRDGQTQPGEPGEPGLLVRPVISGSVGPYGAALCDGSEFSGAYNESVETYKKFHYERVKYFVENPDVDMLAIETIPVFDEVKALVSLMEEDLPREYSETRAEQARKTEAQLDGSADDTGGGSLCQQGTKNYILSFSIKDAHHLADGTPISTVIDYLKNNTTAFLRRNLVAIGGNCLKLRYSTEFLRNLQKYAPTDFPLVMYPNSGEIYDGIKKVWFPDPELLNNQQYEWENLVAEWIKCGARLIGGCCRVGPNDVARISKTIQEYNRG